MYIYIYMYIYNIIFPIYSLLRRSFSRAYPAGSPSAVYHNMMTTMAAPMATTAYAASATSLAHSELL